MRLIPVIRVLQMLPIRALLARDVVDENSPRAFEIFSGDCANDLDMFAHGFRHVVRILAKAIAQGRWCNLLHVRKAGVLSRHRQPAPVINYVIKGKWRYLEHDRIATEGSFVFEPPGETHTLTVPDDVEEMITFFNISGCMYYVDEDCNHPGFEDVFAKIDMCAAHYAKNGLSADFVQQFVR